MSATTDGKMVATTNTLVAGTPTARVSSSVWAARRPRKSIDHDGAGIARSLQSGITGTGPSQHTERDPWARPVYAHKTCPHGATTGATAIGLRLSGPSGVASPRPCASALWGQTSLGTHTSGPRPS